MKETIEINFEKEDISNFIQGNAEKYMSKFEKMKENNKKYSWNWAAFLFGGFWFIYRKMYLYGIGFGVISFVLEELTKVSWVSWIVSILGGLFGNYIYLNHCNKKLADIVDLDYSDKQSELLKQGGVSIGAVILTFLIIIILSVIYAFFIAV